jgi:hypothetical protein
MGSHLDPSFPFRLSLQDRGTPGRRYHPIRALSILSGAIFVIPVRLRACDVPERLKGRHWVNLYREDGYEKLRQALLKRAEALSISPGPGRLPASEAGARSAADTFKALGGWMTESKSRWSNLVGKVADDKPEYRLPHGLWLVGYMVLDEFEQPSLPDLLALLERVRGHESGWPPWLVSKNEQFRPYPFHGAIECRFGEAWAESPVALTSGGLRREDYCTCSEATRRMAILRT